MKLFGLATVASTALVVTKLAGWAAISWVGSVLSAIGSGWHRPKHLMQPRCAGLYR